MNDGELLANSGFGKKPKGNTKITRRRRRKTEVKEKYNFVFALLQLRLQWPPSVSNHYYSKCLQFVKQLFIINHPFKA